MPHKMLELLRHSCDTLIEGQLRDDGDDQGGIWCPGCQTVHGRCGDAIFPLYYLYVQSGRPEYAHAARLLRRFIAARQQRDGSWLNELSAEWKGTTVFQLLSLCHAYQYLSAHDESAEAETLKEMIASAAEWVSAEFGGGGNTNINYYLTSAVALYRAHQIVGAPHYARQAERLMNDCIDMNLTRDGFLVGEKTVLRPHTRVSSTVDIGYNLDMSLGAIAEYAVITGNERIRRKAVLALRKHMEMIYPDGSMDNSFGSRNYKWTLYGSKTAHGCQIAFMLLCDQDPSFYRAAELSTSYLAQSLRESDGLFGGGPMHEELFRHGCIHTTFNRADALATALAYGREPARSDAAIPSEAPFGVRGYAELGVLHLRSGRWMGTVSCGSVQNAPAGGTISYLWHEGAGPVQLGSLTKYRRYESFNMPPAPAGYEEPVTPRIEAVRQGMVFANLYEYDAYSASVGDAEAVEVRVQGKLKYEEDGSCYDCGILYAIRYRFDGNRMDKEYELDVRLPCDRAAIIEPIVTRSDAVSDEAEGAGRLLVALARGKRLAVSGGGAPFALDEQSLTRRAASIFPAATAVPLRWETGPLAPGVYRFKVSLEIIDP